VRSSFGFAGVRELLLLLLLLLVKLRLAESSGR
jgi:hypothetical protein